MITIEYLEQNETFLHDNKGNTAHVGRWDKDVGRGEWYAYFNEVNCYSHSTQQAAIAAAVEYLEKLPKD